jgi:hypothetical protein
MIYFRTTIVIFFIQFSQVLSQSSFHSFWKLSCPEKTWVICHPFVAKKIFRLTKEVQIIANEMKEDSLLDGDGVGGQVDAFRHGFWMATLSQKFCWKKALSLGRAHEKGNYRSFKKGKADEEGVLPDSVSSAMDLFNNLIGASIGCNNKDLDQDKMKALVKSAVLEGKMLIIHKNRKGIPVDSSGNIIPFSGLKSTWKTFKTLVPSNIQRTE